MPKLLTLMFCVAAFLMLLTSSCMSQEQKMLTHEVKAMNETLPQEVAGVKFESITYSTKTEVVTLELKADNTLAEMAVSSAPALIKQGLIAYLKSSSGNPDLVYAIRKAGATLFCICTDSSEKEIATFEITPQELM